MCSTIAVGAKPAMPISIVIASSGWRLTMKKVTVLAVIAHGRDIEIGHVVGRLGVVCRNVDGEPKRLAATVERGVVERVVDRLPPGRAAGLGHDRRDHVHQLRDAGDLHPVGAADEGVEDAADERARPRNCRPPRGAAAPPANPSS